MLGKVVILCVSIYSIISFAAFNEQESKELISINKKSSEMLQENDLAILDLSKSIESDFPEKTKELNSYEESWRIFIKNKCKFNIYESMGSDAEAAEYNKCIYNEQNKFKQELERIISMP
jgi:hypothetical protein